MPVLVKKILRISELATEYSVSAIWKLSKYEERVLMEALQVGAFQKLLLLIQVGCSDETKEKATELLKLLNPYRPGLECIDSLDFKDIKRCE
ncbi:hypothetical protein like AT3G02840 [Hibiscus trionum]|uniref:U-box domain-containing protein n=1 Tax=Hibiscus trionum TaxID=183268 RepID=A0A9W7IXE2_HIBTR|nr:hypothetical protein like AT3G02840 [Hibiscus trionum]